MNQRAALSTGLLRVHHPLLTIQHVALPPFAPLHIHPVMRTRIGRATCSALEQPYLVPIFCVLCDSVFLMLFRAVLCCAVLCCAVLCCAVLCCAVSFLVMLFRCVALCCVVLCIFLILPQCRISKHAALQFVGWHLPGCPLCVCRPQNSA